MKISFPTDVFNEAVRDGSAGPKLERISAAIQPESMNLTEMDGVRTAIAVVDIASAADIPRFAEPWFLTFEAKCTFHPIMSPDDLAAAGLDELGKEWG